MTKEQQRLQEDAAMTAHWRRWGPYLSERQWGTVREDYSENGDAWNYLTHEDARLQAYRWGEDGIAGISDNHQRLCFSLALWNGQDPILKERLFGLSNPQGNHGEDVKEVYWYLDALPSHAYLRMVYRYPLKAFPYQQLISVNQSRGRDDVEYELVDTGIFDGDAYADVEVEYAKATPEEIVCRITATNFSSQAATLYLIPTLWFRNDWSWNPHADKPVLTRTGPSSLVARHLGLGERVLRIEDEPDMVFTENETNLKARFGVENTSPHVKDAFHRYLIHGEQEAVCRDQGTKAALIYRLHLEPGARQAIHLQLSDRVEAQPFDAVQAATLLEKRRNETDEFYDSLHPAGMSADDRKVQRQALSGMIWSKQWYHYAVDTWLEGDKGQPPPPASRLHGRNHKWMHLYSDDILSMPDTWEYPWFAAWDSGFHALPLALVDLPFAKRQLTRFTREWFMHPNGQIPAYEWSFSDVNPPVHAWSAFKVYSMERDRGHPPDIPFLEGIFHKLLMNFTWWVNRKDRDDNNVFEGGFLGMDNIGVFDRSNPPPIVGNLEQSDATSWVAMYSLNLLRMAWELAKTNPAYEDVASKFFEHFLHIAAAMHDIQGQGSSLWHEEDGFFYDQIRYPNGSFEPLRIRSMVGLIPLLAVEILEYEQIDQFPGFRRRMDWFFENRPELTNRIFCLFDPGSKRKCMLSLLTPEQLRRVLAVMLDENEFLSPFGIRSLSRIHGEQPFVFRRDEFEASVHYEPGESSSSLFGGNSNWRGPIWFPINYILIDALRRYHQFWGDNFQVECPTGSGNLMNLKQVAAELAGRLIRLFQLENGTRPVYTGKERFEDQAAWRDRIHFYEYFHAETGEGLGASHQTGWTGLVANLLHEFNSKTSRATM